MSNYSSLKATINANVKQNGNQEITGAIMNSVLNAMVDSLGAGYQYKGVATPATNPGTPDYNVFYLASEAGTYTNFGGIVIGDNEVAALVYNGSWSKQTTGAATASEVSQLAQQLFTLENIPYSKEKYYARLSTAVVGEQYTFEEVSFYSFAYWLINCQEGEHFKLTTTGNTASAKAFAILDANNVVLVVHQTAVTNEEIIIPTGGKTLIVNTVFTNPYLVQKNVEKYATKEELAQFEGQVEEDFTELEGQIENIDPVVQNSLKGVIFPENTPASIKEAITKVWITSETPSNITKVIQNAPKLYIYDIHNDVGNYRPLVAISPTKNNPATAFSWYKASQDSPRTIKETIKANIRDPYYTDWGLDAARAFVCIEIDWSKVVGAHTSLSIELDTASLNRIEVETSTLKQYYGSIIENSLNGKTVVCFGDSITELNDTNGFRYSDYLAAFSGANIVNVGIGGSQIRQRTEPVDVPTTNSLAYAALDLVNIIQASIDQDFTKQVAAAEYLRDHASDDNTEIVARLQGIDWTKVDVVTIFSGTNDWYSGTNTGTTGTVAKNTTIGAVNYIIQNLLGAYPHIKIFWFTPVVRWVSYTGGSGTAENFGDTYKPGLYTLKEFAALIETEVRLSHLPVCDLYNTLGWNMWNFSNYFPDNDGTHPRKPAGMRGIAARMFGFLLSHKNY